MYQGLLHAHSGMRYLVLMLLLFAIIKSFRGWFGMREFSRTDNMVGLLTMIIMHLQLLVGLMLYFLSPAVQNGLQDISHAMKVPELRFWSVEHIGMMIVAVVLVTLGRVLAKRAINDFVMHKRIALFFTAGLILIIIAIPWPFSQISRAWF